MDKIATVIDHPLVRHKLTLMRRKDASTAEFRRLMREIGALLAYEVTRDLPLDPVEIETPVAATRAHVLEGKKLCLVSNLRRGLGAGLAIARSLCYGRRRATGRIRGF